MKYILRISIFIVISASCVAMAAPKPVMVQGKGLWTADVKFTKIEQIMFKSQQGQKPQRYWYTILTVTNNTGNDFDFYPNCHLMTDTFQIIPAGQGVPAEVFNHIKKRHTKVYPFIEVLDTSGTKILQGEDNTRDIVVIWRDFDPAAKQVSLFVGGLSNETQVIELPSSDESQQPTKVYLRKTLQMDYAISGDPKFRATPKIKFTGQSWVMR